MLQATEKTGGNCVDAPEEELALESHAAVEDSDIELEGVDALEEEGEDQLEVGLEPEPEEQMQPISDKYFYKEMAKIKERSKSSKGGALPPKKSASAYIIFQKEVSLFTNNSGDCHKDHRCRRAACQARHSA